MAFFTNLGKSEIPQRERSEAFVRAMNEKAREIGMSESHFSTPSGQGITSHTTVRELISLIREAASRPTVREIWGKKTHTFSVGGENEREIALVSTVQQAALEEEYEILGGKTGMWTCDGYDQHNLIMVARSKRCGRIFAGAVLGADSADGRFSAMHELFRVADGEVNEVLRAVSAIAVELDCDFRVVSEPLYEKNADKLHIPASVAKVLAIVTALDRLCDLDAIVTLEREDLQGGSGAVHFEGDRLTVREILHSMLLPSSNTCAYALASLVGGIILEKANGNDR